MKQLFVYFLIAVFAIMGLSACTNDEGGEDLDVITPVDSTESQVPLRKF
ncbi:MAG: hypothetical protein KJP14_01030 [Eudoraea sp.]|nr:hypothetical protein [Eudoraea sp.]MBT8209091.1 hypothetical protein [Eudoraea sp.]NNK29467.1 hypothetical protein [Flavobacteriaceae bacterium]